MTATIDPARDHAPRPGGTGPDFRRIDYLHYDRVEGHWKYVSLDIRLPVSIVPAQASGRLRATPCACSSSRWASSASARRWAAR
jgi:hypothetical protein